MRTMLLHRLKVMSAAIVLLALSGGRLGLALREQPAEGGSPPAAPAAEQPQKQGSPAPKTDRLDAPLPEGAIARLGSLRLRVGSAALGFSSDGKTIITVRGGRQVKTWDADTGKLREERELPRPVSSGTCLSADGRWLAAQDPDFDTPIDIWDVFAGKRLHRLRQSKGLGIYRAEFSPGGKMLAVAPHNASEGVVYLWDMKSGEQRVLQGAAILPNSLAFSPDGKLLAAASGRYVVCWNTANGERLWRIEGARDLSLAFTPDARTLIVAPGFQRPTRPPWRALDAATGKPSDRLKLPEGYVNSELAVAPDGRTLVFAQSRGAPGSDGRVRIWDLGAGKLLHTLDAHGPFGPFSPDGRSFLTNDGALQRWHLATGQPLLAESGKQGHTGEVTRVIYSPDGRRIASTSRDATIRLWDVATALPLHILRGHEREAWGLAFTPDGKRLVSGCSEGELFIWDTQSGKEVRRIPLHDAKRGEKKQNVSRLHVTTDGQTVVVLGYDPSDSGNSTGVRPKAILSGWDLATGRRKSRVEVPLSGGLYTAFSPDGKLLASQGQLLDTATGRRRAKLEGRTDYLGFYASSSDGRLVTGLLTHAVWEGNRGMTKVDGIAVWDAGSGRELRRIPTDWVGQIAFSPDCRYLVAADLEGLRLWELASGQVVLRHKAHDRTGGSYGPSFASCLSFAPDGRSLATGHSDSTILVWDMAPLAPAAEMPRLWQELADSEASRAYASSWRLTDSPREALRLLRRHLRPAAPAPAEQARRLLADLDSEDFARREAAAAELRQLGDRAEKALREALAANPSLEKRRRLEKLLKVVDASPTPHMLRQLRAVAVLERIGNEEARKLLKELAEGDGDIRQTRAARASLQRLAR